MASCSDSHTRQLEVQLVTGLVPGPEFVLVETTLFSADPANPGSFIVRDTVEARARFGLDYQTGHRVAGFSTGLGGYRVRVRLRRADGSVLAEQGVAVTFNTDYTVRVHITRDCAGVECPGAGSPALIACLNGRCVDPRCDATHREYCPEISFCLDADSCSPTSSCAEQACLDGVCTEQPIEGACADTEWCNPEASQGCEPLVPAVGGMTCGTICTELGNACRFGYWNCSSSPALCDTLTNRPAGTVCGPADVCDLSGNCVACPADAACQIGCATGTVSCASGAPLCVLSAPATFLPEGSACRDVGTCIAGMPCVTNGICDGAGTCRTDGNTPGVIVEPLLGLITSEAGATAELTVRLASAPTADVTMTLTSTDTTEGTVAPTPLVFTDLDWNAAHVVTLTGVDDVAADGAQAYAVQFTLTSDDEDYAGYIVPDVSATNEDDETVGVTVTPTSGLTTTEAGGTATFSVALNTMPSNDVTITLSSSDVGEGMPSPASITFTPEMWDSPQTVTVIGADDFITDASQGYIIRTEPATSADTGYDGYDASDVSVTNLDDEMPNFTVTPTTGLGTTESGGIATFTVRLTTQPTSSVVFDLMSLDLSEGSVAPSTLSFTDANWNVTQTVTVTGIDDALADGAQPYVVRVTPNASSDADYTSLPPVNVGVTNADNDVAAVLVTPSSGLVTTEAGGSATFSVVLATQPTSNVTVSLASSNVAEGSVAPASLTFTTVNWSTPRTVTVTGVNDNVDDGNSVYSIVTGAAASSDTDYSGMAVLDVSVTNTDDDTAGVTVTPTSGLVTTEAGGTAVFTLVLTSQPTANVSMSLASSDASEGSVSPASVTFTTANWATVRTVTVTGINDSVDDGNVSYNILTGAASSTDAVYNGLTVADVSVTNTDNDAASITVTPTSGLATTEVGGTASFVLALTSQPTASVTISLASSDTSEGTVSPASITFTTVNWATPRTVTLTGVDDAVSDGDIAYTIVTGAASSSDSLYDGMNVADVSSVNTDNDMVGIVVSPTSGLITTEAGATAMFTIVLMSQPTANVSISLMSTNVAEGTVFPTSVTFTDTNWNTPQTVVVTGVDDLVIDADIAYVITTSAATSGDVLYAGIDPANVSVTNRNDDVIPYVQQEYVKASNAGAGDYIGQAVAMSADGNTMAVGAYGEDSVATGPGADQSDNSASQAGAVYVFTRVGSVWTQQAYIKASNTTSQDYFGYNLTLSADGDTLAVGAYGEDSNATGVNGDGANNSAMQSGAVYVFRRSGVTWSQEAYVKASNTGASDNFSASLQLSDDGNTLVVSSTAEGSNATGIGGNQADNSAAGAGAAYVFTRVGVVWSQEAYIKASNTDAGDQFGVCVALSGDGNTLAVGATYERSNATGIGGNQADNSLSNAGAVYAFTRSGGVWTQQAYIKASNTGSPDSFGRTLAVSSDGNTLAVGAIREASNATGIGGNQADNSMAWAGAVYVFTRSGVVWTQQAYVKASNTNGGDIFGDSLSISDDGNTLAVGADGEASNASGVNGNQADNSMAGAGAVYVFRRVGVTWTQRAYLKASNPGASDYFGRSVDLSADAATLVVGAYSESSAATGPGGDQTDNSALQAGAVYVFVTP